MCPGGISTVISSLLLTFVSCAEVVFRDNGCPYPFDFGKLGFNYTKPSVCRHMMPPIWDGKSPPVGFGRELGLREIRVMMSLDFYKRSTDTYQLVVEVKNAKLESFRIVAYTVKAYEVYSNGSLGTGGGHFERQDDYVPYCCAESKRRNMIRFVNSKGQRPWREKVRWAPLRFTGKIKFMANVFDSPTKWFANISTEVYTIPLARAERKSVELYDEDWAAPGEAKFIPEF